MSALKGLSFIENPRNTKSNPEIQRRNKLILRLEQQLKLSKDTGYAPTKIKWLPDSFGVKQPIEVRKRISPWWRMDAAGRIALVVKYGSKPIEFEKGKSAIMIASKDQLPATIEKLIKAVAEGEVDNLLVSVTTRHKEGFRKRAA